MRYGFYLPTRGQTATADALEAILASGEALGFTSVMVADHVVFPTQIESKYPYTVNGAFPGHGDALEQLTLMAFVAAKTRTLRLVSSVMILPHRNPVVTAKMLATIDVLSSGRLTVGVGVDTNVLVFERIREELRAGKTVKAAVSNGFERVWITILDTHATALIAAAFLYQFGTGPIRGFAVTLVMGLIANVFASYFVSKFLFEWVLGSRGAVQPAEFSI